MFHQSNSRVVSIYCRYSGQLTVSAPRPQITGYKETTWLRFPMLTDSSKLEPNKASGTGGSKQNNRPHSQDVSETMKNGWN